MATISEAYTSFFKKLTLEELLPSVIERAKDVILDTLGVGIGGSHSPVSYTHLTLPTNREV